MIFRQLFDGESFTYTYLIASRQGGEAIIIDPVLEKVERYLQLLGELDLRLVKAVDTHVHADHITGLGSLRDRTRCITVMSEHSQVDVVSMRVGEGDSVTAEGIALRTIYTPGHTDDSCCFVLDDRVFTGDTLLIRGTGRTDFQNGDPRAQYDSIFNKLLKLPEESFVYPAHDYKGDTVSTIGEEKSCNPRLRAGGVDEYVEIMDNLNLPNPRMMDVAVPANLRIGLSQDELLRRGWAYRVGDVSKGGQGSARVLVDLRDDAERQKNGVIAGSVHAPYLQLDDNVRAGGMLHELAETTRKEIVFYCAYGERSAMAVQIAREAGLDNIRHIHGGIAAWREADLPLTQMGS